MIRPVNASTVERKSNVQEALEGRVRHVEVIDLGQFFPGLKTTRIGFRRPTKGEQDRALDAAHKYVATVTTSAEARADHELLADAKAAAVVHMWCREVAPKLDGSKVVLDEYGAEIWEPTGHGAFPSVAWLAEHLAPEEIAVLINAANFVRARRGPAPVTIDDDAVEAYLEACAKSAETEIPERELAGCSHEYLAQLVVLASVKLRAARAEIERLEADIAARDAVQEPESQVDSGLSPRATGRLCADCGTPEVLPMPRVSPCNGDILRAHTWKK
jgi:hypothetical protein